MKDVKGYKNPNWKGGKARIICEWCKNCKYVINPEINPSSCVGCQVGVHPFPILKSMNLERICCGLHKAEEEKQK